MRLLQMTYFLTAADAGSITKAAGLLYVSQPALSKQIALLEEEIGTPLLKRQSRGVQLTDAGIQFAKDCRKILSEINEAATRAALIGNAGSKTFRIGCFDGAFVDDFMPRLYQHLRQYDPDMKIKLLRQMVGENRRAWAADEIDLLIEPLVQPVSDDKPGDLMERKLLVHRRGALIYSGLSPLAQKEHLCFSDFTSVPLLLSGSKDNEIMTEHALETLHLLGLTNPQIEYTDNIMTVMTSLSLGHGYSLMTRDVADSHPGLLAFELPEEYGLDIVAVWKRKNALACACMESL